MAGRFIKGVSSDETAEAAINMYEDSVAVHGYRDVGARPSVPPDVNALLHRLVPKKKRGRPKKAKEQQ